MIRIIKDGIDFDLTGTSIRWETVNSLFESNSLQGDYTFPFTLPYTDKNKKLLNFAHLTSVGISNDSHAVTIRLANKSLIGKLKILSTNEKGYKCSIAVGFITLSNAGQSLKDLDLGDDIDLADVSNLSAFETADADNIIAFPPHFNSSFYDGKNTDFLGVINKQDADYGTYMVNDIFIGSKYAQVPFIYIHYILERIFKANNLRMRGDAWVDQELRTALLYNNRALDKIATSTAGMYIVNDGQNISTADSLSVIEFDQTLSGYYVNNCTWSAVNNRCENLLTGEYSIRMALKWKAVGDNLNTTRIYIQLYVNGVSVATKTIPLIYGQLVFHANVSITYGDTISFVANLASALTVLASSDTATINITTASLSISITQNIEYNEMDTVVTLTNHVPDVNILDFINWYKAWANVIFDIDEEEGVVNMDFSNTLIRTPQPIDLTANADPNPVQYFAIPKGYTVAYDFGDIDQLAHVTTADESRIVVEKVLRSDFPNPAFLGDLAVELSRQHIWEVQLVSSVLTWVDLGTYAPTVVEGAGDEEITISLAPMAMTHNYNYATSGGSKPALMPYISEKGNSPMFGLGTNNPMSLRVVFMRGLVNGASTGYYVFASSANYTYEGAENGNYSLNLGTQNSWYERYLRAMLDFINAGQLVEYKVMLPLRYLQYKGVVQIANVNYFIKSVSTPIGNKIGQSIMKLLKL